MEKTVKLERKKGNLGFSIKGGYEHGIPIVVSSIEKNTVAASQLTLGDELLSVNGLSLHGVTHNESVSILKTAGQSVIMRIRTNPVLQSTFISMNEGLKKHIHESSNHSSVDPIAMDVTATSNEYDSLPLPNGWSMKKDHKTDRPYFENHYTKVSTWTDPRSLESVPINEFNFNALPPNWEKFIDEHGDIYYVNHDSQTTHWDTPRGMREQQQLKELEEFIKEQKIKLKEKQDELKDKRTVLLSKTNEENNAGKDEEEIAENVEDIITLNEEIEELENNTHATGHKLQQLNTILHSAYHEDIDGKDLNAVSTEITRQLQKQFISCKEIDSGINSVLQSLEEFRLLKEKESSPLQYMLQLKPQDHSKDDSMEESKWIHLLPDKLTAKTNTEMRLTNCILSERLPQLNELLYKVNGLYSSIFQQGSSLIDWEQVLGQLVNLDFSVMRDELINDDNFREKLSKYANSDT